jgi:hypothetical protein
MTPMAPHARWDGQITDGTNTYVSYAGWLDHLQQVLEQNPTQQWKVAVLNTATLSCLRGRALSLYNSMTVDQWKQLRTDVELRYWQEWGRPLCRNSAVARAEARDRKRGPGETLTEYSWTKLAMLNEAYGSQRPAIDIIRDIKDGLTPSDQEKIRTDLETKPSVARLVAEMERMDTIRGSTFQTSTTPHKAVDIRANIRIRIVGTAVRTPIGITGNNTGRTTTGVERKSRLISNDSHGG